MVKQCPNCLSEYQNSASICPDDQGVLVIKANDGNIKLNSLLRFYATADKLEALRIIHDLEQEGITCGFMDSKLYYLPQFGDVYFIITIDPKQKDKAKMLLSEARQSGVLSISGAFL